MSVWRKGTPADDLDFGARIDIDDTGPVWVRVLSPSYLKDDGDEYCNIGHGVQVIVPPEYFEE